MTPTRSQQILELVRSGSTLRFHAQAGITLKTQDVAQHCYGVFWLVHALTGGQASASLLVAAMVHDAGERWVGDIPSPTKRAIPGLGAELDKMEADALFKRTGFVAPKLTITEAAVLKLADALDGAAYCEREMQLGNTLMKRVLRNFVSYADGTYSDWYAALNQAEGQGFRADQFSLLMAHFRKVAE